MLSVDTSDFRWTALLGVTLCVVLTGCQAWLSGQEQDSEEQTERTVFALAHLMPATGVIDIRATPGDRLTALAEGVSENELIPESGILGTLDSYDMGKSQLLALEQKKQLASQEYQHQKHLAAAQLAQAKASQAQAQAKQKEVALQEIKLVVLEEAMALENAEFRKLKRLSSDDPELVTAHQLAKQKNKLDMAMQKFRIAKSSYAPARQAADMAVAAAAASCDVAELVHRQASQGFSAQLKTQLIEQEIEVAEEALKRSVLLAPQYSKKALDELIRVKTRELSPQNGQSEEPSARTATPNAEPGANAGPVDQRPDDPARYTALKIHCHNGEIITQAPIMQLGNLSKMVCIAEVYEADRKELYLHQKAIIRSPAFSGYFADGEVLDEQSMERRGGIHGVVTRIGRMVAPPGLASRNPLAPADRSVVEVRIEIDAQANRLAVDRAKQALQARGAQPNAAWDDVANEHAAKNVGLQVTVEFGNPPGQNSPADEADPDHNSKSSE